MADQTDFLWKVVPISKYQLLDVRPEDIVEGGDFRNCLTYRGGGGYDQFSYIAQKRLGVDQDKYAYQFVCQLYGCNLDCPYCYVTRSGVWGKYKNYTTEDIVRVFESTGKNTFHLMGGAPALYIEHWPNIIQAIHSSSIFHSDILLTEKSYSIETMRQLRDCIDNCLYAVDIKGVTKEDYEKNTRKVYKEELFYFNLEKVVQYLCKGSQFRFYLTFTNPDENYYEQYVDNLIKRFGKEIMEDSFIIPLIDYKSTNFVDEYPNFLEIV